MSAINETGFAQNVANLKKIISAVTTDGIAFNPSTETIKPDNLRQVITNAENVLSEVNAARSFLAKTISDRRSAFSSLGRLITRVVSFLKASGAPGPIIGTASAIIRDLRGVRASKKDGAAAISVSQRGFVDKLNYFDRLIKLLAEVPEYAPNEADLKIAALMSNYTDMKTRNELVIKAIASLKNIRMKRNDIFNARSTGLIDVAQDTKMYIKAIYGATSPQYQAVSRIRFRRLK